MAPADATVAIRDIERSLAAQPSIYSELGRCRRGMSVALPGARYARIAFYAVRCRARPATPPRRGLGGGILLTLPARRRASSRRPISAPPSQFDWAQYEGQRDTRMVQFTGEWTSNCQYNTRFGCGSVLTLTRASCRPTARRRPGDGSASASCITRLDDPTERPRSAATRDLGNGDEEWRVIV